MINFFKNLFSKVNFHSENEQINKLNKIIYSVIILCAIAFIGIIIYFVVKAFPSFWESVKYNWNETKSTFKNYKLY